MDLLKPDDDETRALLNLVENKSLKIVKHGATYHTRINTYDTHINIILVNEQYRLLNYYKFSAPYARNRHDIITATTGLFLVEPSIATISFRE